MRQSVRVIIFNSDEDYSATLRSELLALSGVQIVAEVDEPALIPQAVSQFKAEVLIAHLDPLPEIVLPIATEVAQTHPGMAVFVISESTDGQNILTAMRGGVREFLTKPLDPQLLTNAVSKVMSQSTSTVELGTMVSILGTIGGVGSSVLATNLACEIADLTGRDSVALVDLDFRYGQLGTLLDLQADYTIADLADTPEQIDQGMIKRAMVKHGCGVHLLARPNNFNQANQITAAHCSSVLSTLQQMYEYVIIDGPTRFDPGGLTVLDLADMNLLLIQLLVTSVRNVHRMVEELRESGYNLQRFKLICNRIGRDSSLLGIDHVEDTLNLKVFHQIPDDWKAVSSAINMGVPLIEAAPKSRTRQAIRELAGLIINDGMSDSEHEDQQSKSGFLGRIFSGAS